MEVIGDKTNLDKKKREPERFRQLRLEQPRVKIDGLLTNTETAQAKKLLASLRGWSDDLMEFVVDGNEAGPVVEVAQDLIKDLEGRYRSLQTLVLKSKREIGQQ